MNDKKHIQTEIFFGKPSAAIEKFIKRRTYIQFSDGTKSQLQSPIVTTEDIQSLYSSTGEDYTSIAMVFFGSFLSSYQVNALQNISALQDAFIPYSLSCGQFHNNKMLSSIASDRKWTDQYGNKYECLNASVLTGPFLNISNNDWSNSILSASLCFPNTTSIKINRSTKITTAVFCKFYSLQNLEFPELTSISYDAGRCYGLFHLVNFKRLHVPQLDNICEYFLRNCGSAAKICYIDFRGRVSEQIPSLPAGSITPFHKSYFRIVVDNGKKSVWTADEKWSAWADNIIESDEYEALDDK